ncbi:MAG: pyruvate kinase [Bacteroidales bacterium]|jgi:pyruvate kinase|nr:pyruvate kinase [Bacteroidales bacterium]MDN5329573.1 pyruvate kinase [Bacteroidales bacterium]
MKTKIVATLGPASSSPDKMEALIKAGVDVFRINFSHADPEALPSQIKILREIINRYHGRCAILGDLQGPKIRIGEVKGNAVKLEPNMQIRLAGGNGISDESLLWISYNELSKDVKPGETILLDDGKLSLKVESRTEEGFLMARVLVGGILTHRKGVNLPESRLTVPSLTEKDHADLKLASQLELDWIALSFVRSAKDITELRKEIRRLSRNWNPGIIAKIEKPEAVKNLDEIIEVADALMVARGDLGVEMPFEQVPAIQKTIIRKAVPMCKPVIVATQMLEGMLTNTRPTRAEINDVANSVMDGADALMLSGETSTGQYPVEAVEAMSRIIAETEKFPETYHRPQFHPGTKTSRAVSDAIIGAAVELSMQLEAKALLTYTLTGYTARKLSSLRPYAPIFIFAKSLRLIRRLNLHWGVTGFVQKNLHYTDDNLGQMLALLLREQQVQKGDVVIKIAGFPMKEKVKSNMVVVSRV